MLSVSVVGENGRGKVGGGQSGCGETETCANAGSQQNVGEIEKK